MGKIEDPMTSYGFDEFRSHEVGLVSLLENEFFHENFMRDHTL